MQTDPNTPVKARFAAGGIALRELLNVRCLLHEWYSGDSRLTDDSIVPTEELYRKNPEAHDTLINYSNYSNSIKRGLPQFAEYGKLGTDDPEDKRVCTINELHALAADLIDSGHMTVWRVETINQAYENLTGCDSLVEVVRD